MGSETFRIDRRRRDDDLQVGATSQKLLEIAEEEVDVQASLVSFVDDDDGVLRQSAVVLHLREQDAIGHRLDGRPLRDLVGETNLVANQPAQLITEL